MRSTRDWLARPENSVACRAGAHGPAEPRFQPIQGEMHGLRQFDNGLLCTPDRVGLSPASTRRAIAYGLCESLRKAMAGPQVQRLKRYLRFLRGSSRLPPTRNFQRVRAGNFDLPALGEVTFRHRRFDTRAPVEAICDCPAALGEVTFRHRRFDTRAPAEAICDCPASLRLHLVQPFSARRA